MENYSHLFTVWGSDPELTPYMLLAHIDVVPANEADGWKVPPFSAQELNGFIYGRGAIDNKQSVMVWLGWWAVLSFSCLRQCYVCLFEAGTEFDHICLYRGSFRDWSTCWSGVTCLSEGFTSVWVTMKRSERHVLVLSILEQGWAIVLEGRENLNFILININFLPL